MTNEETLAEALEILRASKSLKSPMGSVMLMKIASFHHSGKIVFDASLPGTRYGESFENFVWGRIRLNSAWEGDPVSAAAAIAHEAAHLASRTQDRVEQELECRVFDAQLIAELIAGLSYLHEDTAGMVSELKSAKITSSFQLWNGYQALLSAAQADQIIDMILHVPDYAVLLKADWLVLHLGEWGGLRNRWPNTLGVFIRALVGADSRPAFFAPYVLEVMGAISVPNWQLAKPGMGDFGRVQAMMSYIEKLPNPAYGRTIDVLERTFGDRLRLF